MKRINYLFIFTLMGICLFSCKEDDNIDTNAVRGGLVEVSNPLVNYVVGDGATYTASLKVYQGEVKTTSVDVYKQFTGALGTSNRALLTTIPITAGGTGFASFDFTYQDLIAGLTIGGAALPTSDAMLSIGDEFTLSYESSTSEGNLHLNRGTTSVAVSTRFAGIYTTVASLYVHPTAGPQGGWNGETVTIKSVDATTYQILANGPFTTDQDPDNEFYFTVDPVTLVIDIPKNYNGEIQTVWSADEVANCVNDAALLPDVNCGTSNIAIKDDVNGNDKLIMSHGYIRSSGTRQFYYELVKM